MNNCHRRCLNNGCQRIQKCEGMHDCELNAEMSAPAPTLDPSPLMRRCGVHAGSPALASACSVSESVTIPAGYRAVLVPEGEAPSEPDWDEVKRQAEVATGLKVEPHTFSIVIREVRRWITQRDQTETQSPA